MVTAKQLLDFLRARPAPPLPAGRVVYGLVDGAELPLLSVSGFRAVPTYDTAGPAYWTVTCSLKVVDKSQDTAESLLGGYLAWLEGAPTLAGDPLPGLRSVFVDAVAIEQAELFVFEVVAAVTLVVDRV